MLLDAKLGQIIYSLVPGKGYTSEARATSQDSHEGEFKGLTNSFTPPIYPRLFELEEDGFEARMVSCTDRVVFVTRFFFIGPSSAKKFHLDEHDREGLVWHVGVVPRELLDQGLTLRRVDEAMGAFLRGQMEKFQIPLGATEKMPVSWGDKPELDPDLDGMKQTVSKDIAQRVVQAFDKEYAKVFVRYGDGVKLDRFGWPKRASMTFNFAKFLIRYGIKRPFTVVSEALHQGVILFYPNVVIVSARDEYYTNDPAWVYAAIPKLKTEGDTKRNLGVFGDVYGEESPKA